MRDDIMSKMAWYFDEEYLYESGFYAEATHEHDGYVTVMASKCDFDCVFFVFLCDGDMTVQKCFEKLDTVELEKIFNQDEFCLADEIYVAFLRQTEQETRFSHAFSDLYNNTGPFINVYAIEQKTDGQYCLVLRHDDYRYDVIPKLVYAFNNKDADVYQCIIEDSGCLSTYHDGKSYSPQDFFTAMSTLYDTYGEMKTGYMRNPDGFVEKVPYIEGYGYFKLDVVPAKTDRIAHSWRYNDSEWEVSENKRRVIHSLQTVNFCDGGESAGHFAGESVCEKAYKKPAELVGVSVFEPNMAERFALRLCFADGQVRKYAHFTGDAGDDEGKHPVCIAGKSFTDEIWASAHLADISPYAEAVVSFENGAVFSGAYLYENSTPYCEPIVYDEPVEVYSDKEYEVKKIWECKDVVGVGEAGEDDIFCLITESVSAHLTSECEYEKCTFVSCDGKRLTSLDFDHDSAEFFETISFKNQKACVFIDGKFRGYVNPDMSLERIKEGENYWDYYATGTLIGTLQPDIRDKSRQEIEAKLGGEKPLWLYDGRYAVVKRHYIPHNVVEVYRVIKK